MTFHNTIVEHRQQYLYYKSLTRLRQTDARVERIGYCDVIGGEISVLSIRPHSDRPTVFSKHDEMLSLVVDISGNIDLF